MMDSNNGSENNNTQFPRRLFRLLSMGCGISRVDQSANSKDDHNHEGSDGGQFPIPTQPHQIHTPPVRFYRNFYCLGGDQSKPLIRTQSAIVDSDPEDHSTKPESSSTTTTTTTITTTTLPKDETIVAVEKMTMKRQDSNSEIEENHTSTEKTILIIEKEPEKPPEQGHINPTNNSFDGFFRNSKLNNNNNNNNMVIEDDDNYYNGVYRGGSPSFREYCVDFDAPTSFKSQDTIDGVIEESKWENEETDGMETPTITAKKERRVRSFMNALQRRRAGRVRNFLNAPRRHAVQPNTDFSQSQSNHNDTSQKLLAKAS